MAVRIFHPKAILYSIYAILFLSNLYVSAVMLPLLSVFMGGLSEINWLAFFIPIIAGFVLSELLSGSKLLKAGIVGSTFISVSSAMGIISNKAVISALIWLSEKFPEAYLEQISSNEPAMRGILGNINSAGAEVNLAFVIAFIGFNIPVLYRLLKDDSVEKKYLLGCIIPVAVFAVLYLILKSLSLFGSAP
jgi:hypothetical protein